MGRRGYCAMATPMTPEKWWAVSAGGCLGAGATARLPFALLADGVAGGVVCWATAHDAAPGTAARASPAPSAIPNVPQGNRPASDRSARNGALPPSRFIRTIASTPRSWCPGRPDGSPRRGRRQNRGRWGTGHWDRAQALQQYALDRLRKSSSGRTLRSGVGSFRRRAIMSSCCDFPVNGRFPVNI